MTRRRLVLLRHAKAEPFAATDHARRLTEHGRADALATGEYLQERGLVPDHVVVSDAERTRQTWAAMEEVLGSGAQTVAEGAVYAGSPDVVLEVLRAVPTEVSVLVFVGHQPTVGYVAHLLDDGHGDQQALRLMLHGFPTSSAAVFEVAVPWAELGEETGRLVAFRPGRD